MGRGSKTQIQVGENDSSEPPCNDVLYSIFHAMIFIKSRSCTLLSDRPCPSVVSSDVPFQPDL